MMFLLSDLIILLMDEAFMCVISRSTLSFLSLERFHSLLLVHCYFLPRAAEDDECRSQLRDLQMTYWRLRGQLSTPSLESALRANLARYGAEACYALRLVPSPRPEPTQHSPLLPCRHKHA